MREKTYGKQKVYLVDQSNFKEASSDELKNMEKQIEDTEKAVKSTEQTLKEFQMQLKDLSSSLTTEQARQQVSEVRKSNVMLKFPACCVKDHAIFECIF